MRSLLICGLLIAWVSLSYAQQEQIPIRGQVVHGITKAPLARVHIRIKATDHGTFSSDQGHFLLWVDQLPVTLVLSSIGFATQSIEVSQPQGISIHLQPLSMELSQITVRANPKIDTVFAEPYNVVDYVLYEQYSVLLVYKNVFEQFELVLLNRKEQVIDRLSLRKEKPTSLFKSCRNNIYLNTFYGTYQLNVEASTIQLGDWVDAEIFEQEIQPCVLAKDNAMFYQQYFYQGQALHFYSQVSGPNGPGLETDSIVVLPMIADEDQIFRLIEDVGYRLPWSGDFWDQRISEGLRYLREGPYILKGAMRMFYPKIYAPVFSVGDDLCIINHPASCIQYFDCSGQLLREVPIAYHRNKRWKKQVLCDQRSQKIYTLFDSRWGTYICLIDPVTGALSTAIPIAVDFMEKVSIYNGFIYFLNRNPYAGAQNRMLQKVRIE